MNIVVDNNNTGKTTASECVLHCIPYDAIKKIKKKISQRSFVVYIIMKKIGRRVFFSSIKIYTVVLKFEQTTTNGHRFGRDP